MTPNPPDDEPPDQVEPDPADDLATIDEPCRVFHRTPRALRDWAKRGWLVPVRIGGNVYYRRSDIARLARDGVPRKSRNHKA